MTITEDRAFEIAYDSIQASVKDIGDFNINVTPEDLQEIVLHILANLAQAFGVTGE